MPQASLDEPVDFSATRSTFSRSLLALLNHVVGFAMSSMFAVSFTTCSSPDNRYQTWACKQHLFFFEQANPEISAVEVNKCASKLSFSQTGSNKNNMFPFFLCGLSSLRHHSNKKPPCADKMRTTLSVFAALRRELSIEAFGR